MPWDGPSWAGDAWVAAQPWVERAEIWRGYEQPLQMLLVTAIGIAVYTSLVFAFYQNLSRRRPFKRAPKKGFWGGAVRGAEWVLVFPAISFLYFAVLALSLFVLAKAQGTSQIFLLSMGVVLGVRVTAFISENAAVDLAKLLPLSLLGVMLVDPSYWTIATPWARLLEVPSALPLLGRYFALFIVIEGSLQAASSAVAAWRARAAKRREPLVQVRQVTVMEPANPDLVTPSQQP